MSSYYANLKIDERQDSLSRKVIVEIENNNVDKFQLKMILSACSGVVKPSVIYEENSIILEYDISNMSSFEQVFNTKKSVPEIIDISLDLIDVINQSANYYLDYSLFLIDKKFMFYNNMCSQVMLIYLPVLNFTDIDILQSIKSELFRDASSVYSEDYYSKLLFKIMSSSTLTGLKHSLIGLESKLYDKSLDKDKSHEKEKIIKAESDLIKEPTEAKKKVIIIKEKKSSNEKKSENILKIICGAILSMLIITVFIFTALILKFPMIPSIIVGCVFSILISTLIMKIIGAKSTGLDDVNIKESKVIKFTSKAEVESKTILISDLKNKHKLVNLESGEVHSLVFDLVNTLSLGRSSSADICIDESSIGRNHLNIIKQSDEIYMCDNNSLNGSFINEMQLKPLQNYLIRPEDVICVGETKLMLKIG